MTKAFALFFALVLTGCATTASEAVRTGCALGQRYVQAANSSDASLVADDIHPDASAIFLTGEREAWSSTDGRAAVIDAIETYTRQCGSCRSEVVCLHETPAAQYLVERVHFTDQDGVEHVQSAPLIIELEDGTIRRLVYYPATRNEP